MSGKIRSLEELSILFSLKAQGSDVSSISDLEKTNINAEVLPDYENEEFVDAPFVEEAHYDSDLVDPPLHNIYEDRNMVLTIVNKEHPTEKVIFDGDPSKDNSLPKIEPPKMEEIPMPKVEPRTDPVSSIGMTDEFLTEAAVAKMADTLRQMNDEKLRSNLMAILPQIFGAKSFTAENEVAIYITENALFREWLMAIFKITEIDISHVSRSSVELLDGKMFLSRAPTLFDMRSAVIHTYSLLQQWKENHEKFDGLMRTKERLETELVGARHSLLDIERQRNADAHNMARANRELEKYHKVQFFRIQWNVTGKNNKGEVVTKPVYLALKDTDTGQKRPDGVWPSKHYIITFEESAAETFTEESAVFNTLDFIKSQANRLIATNKAFAPKYLASAVVVQWAQIHHNSRPAIKS